MRAASSTANIGQYILAGLDTTPTSSEASSVVETPAPTPAPSPLDEKLVDDKIANGKPVDENIVTVSSQTYTVISTYYEPAHSNVVAVLNGGYMALVADGQSLTMAGAQIAVQPSAVVVIGQGPSAATVTAPV